MVVVAVAVVVASISLLSIALSIVQFRRITPLAFHCVRCCHDFVQPPHHRFPRHCPRCHARDWAL